MRLRLVQITQAFEKTLLLGKGHKYTRTVDELGPLLVEPRRSKRGSNNVDGLVNFFV